MAVIVQQIKYSDEQYWVHFEQTHLQQTTTNNLHALFQIWKLDMLLNKLVHMNANFHITLIVRKYVAKSNEKLYNWTQFCSSCLQNL